MRLPLYLNEQIKQSVTCQDIQKVLSCTVTGFSPTELQRLSLTLSHSEKIRVIHQVKDETMDETTEMDETSVRTDECNKTT